ncbi:ER to Golgi transport protein Yos1, partial [Wallemia mellicola CBS 633.66]
IGNILYISLLLTNSVAILNEERFLAKIGWTQSNNLYQEQTVKTRLINLISAVRTLMRFPLIILNIIVIVYELLFG